MFANINGWRDYDSFEPHEDYSFRHDQFMFIHLKDCSVRMGLPRPRTMAWAIMLRSLPEPPSDFIQRLQEKRENYRTLQQKYTKDPRAVIGDDPLSQKDESVWNQHFCDNDLKSIILQDVARAFPDEPFFRDSAVQDLMVRVLFVWARANNYIGYRQGMHEILALALLELHYDRSLAPKELSPLLQEYLREDCLECDSFIHFNTIMFYLQKFYMYMESITKTGGQIFKERNSLSEVSSYLEEVRVHHLIPADPELARNLQRCGISMEVFGIRWIRLLFAREFPRADVIHLWSFIFSDGPFLPYLHDIIVAMLMSMRTTIINEEPGIVLSALMRPASVTVAHVIALALHLRNPNMYARPGTPTPANNNTSEDISDQSLEESSVGGQGSSSGGEVSTSDGVDSKTSVDEVASELATLGIVRAQLPAAAAALAAALPRPSPNVARPLHQILQLANLLQSRSHALVDVETALEAAEGQVTEKLAKKHLVPISLILGRRAQPQPANTNSKILVPMKLFHQCESHSVGDLPSLDPLHLRSE